jgi:hypothetical protein
VSLPDLSHVTLPVSDTAYRIVVCAKIINHIRDRLMAGEDYRAIAVPNLQSAMDALVIPFEMLVQSMEDCPEGLESLRPTPTEVAQCAQNLAAGGMFF